MTSDVPHSLNLSAYLERIGYAGATPPTLSTLTSLHRAHASSIPFENLDVLLSRPIRLDLSSLEAKLVTARRGGYCFEQNGLFAAVLEQVGFVVTRLVARVHLGTQRINPRTHMLLLVETEAGPHIADVGFGGWGMLEPMPFLAGEDCKRGPWTYCLENREEHRWLLVCRECPLGSELYSFTLEPQLPVDYEPSNHYCATHPDSRFVQTLTVQLPGLHRRVILRNRELGVFTAAGTQTEVMHEECDVVAVVEKEFGMRMPEIGDLLASF